MQDKIRAFIAQWDNQIRLPYYNEHFPNQFHPLEVMWGKKYARIVADHSVLAFVDMKNGNIYKPAGWAGPTKNIVRGNINSEHGGLEGVSVYGTNYAYR